jgi:hypothetical protein
VNAPAAPGPSRCPRCGQPFHCGMNDAAPCACTGLRLGADQLAALRRTYTGCLCLACLAAVAAGEPLAAPLRRTGATP